MNSYQSVSANFIHGSIPRHVSCIKLFLYLIVKIFSKVRSVHLLHECSGEEGCAKQIYSGKIHNFEKEKKCIGADFLCSCDLNPLHPNISMHKLHTVLYTFPKRLTRRICFTIKSCFMVIIFSILITFRFDSGVIL